MKSLQIRFTPVDTLFFRDGSPFNREELQANVNAVFPPSPTTLAGAVRAAWARALGWDGKGRGGNWDTCCKSRLGAGFVLPENISFNGPYLFRNNEPIFPVPAHILGIVPADPQEQKPSDLVFLAPGRTMETDLGTVLLPVKPAGDDIKGRKSLVTEWWVTITGLQQILLGNPPEENTLIHQSQLWTVEKRIGNYRKKGRVTGLMALYAPQHIRLGRNVELVMFARGLPDSKEMRDLITTGPALTGGEARSCWLTIEERGIEDYLHIEAGIAGKKHTLIALTPTRMEATPGAVSIEGSRPVSCCNQRPIMLGGWNCDKPRELTPCLKPGAVLFMNTENERTAGKIHTHGTDEIIRWGFGRFVTGIWK